MKNGERQRLVSSEATDLYRRMLDGTQPDLPSDVIALAELLNTGLAREDRMLGYLVVDPAAVVARQSAALYQAIADNLTTASVLADEFDDLHQAYLSHAQPSGGGAEYLRGTSTIDARLVSLVGAATSEIITCQPGGPRSEKAREFSGRETSKTLAKGVALRTLYHESARGGAGMDRWVAEMTELGAQFRTLNEPFPRMIIIDRQIAVIPGDDTLGDSDAAVAHVVHDQAVAAFLGRHFDRDWRRAQTWGHPERDGSLSDRALLILQGMAAGDTQSKIGSRLGVSRQVMDAEVRTLKETLNATSLFELGMRYVERLAGGH